MCIGEDEKTINKSLPKRGWEIDAQSCTDGIHCGEESASSKTGENNVPMNRLSGEADSVMFSNGQQVKRSKDGIGAYRSVEEVNQHAEGKKSRTWRKLLSWLPNSVPIMAFNRSARMDPATVRYLTIQEDIPNEYIPQEYPCKGKRNKVPYPYGANIALPQRNDAFLQFLYEKYPHMYTEVVKCWYPPVTPALILEQARKYDQPEILPSDRVADEVVTSWWRETFMPDVPIRPATREEIRIVRDSAAGFPSCLFYSNRGEAYDAFKTVMYSYARKWINGVQEAYWCAYGRGSVLEREGETKNRLVACPDTTFHALAQTFMQPLNDYLSYFKRGFSAVGSSIYYNGLSATYNYLLPRQSENHLPGRCYFSLDVSRWDGSFPAFLMDKVRDLRADSMTFTSGPFTRNEWRELVKNMYEHVKCGSLLFPTGQRIKRERGMPSGWAGTSHDNSLAHVWLFYYSLLVALRRTSEGLPASLRRIKDTDVRTLSNQFRITVMGDDLLGSCPADAKEWLEAGAVTDVYKELGFLIKAGSFAVHEELSQLRWCSRFGRQLPNGKWVVYRPPVEALARIAFPRWEVPFGEAGLPYTLAACIGHYIENVHNAVVREVLEGFVKEYIPKGTIPVWGGELRRVFHDLKGEIPSLMKFPTRMEAHRIHTHERVQYPESVPCVA